MLEKTVDKQPVQDASAFGLTNPQAIESLQKAKDTAHDNWLVDNIVAPAVNSGVLDLYNTAAGVVNKGTHLVSGHDLLPKCDLMNVPKADFGSGAWLSQTVFGGAAALIPYVIAGKATGAMMRSTGAAFEMEGLGARFMASERSAQILGAGLYDFSKEPGEGQTRFGNAMGSMVGFSFFELGNGLVKGLPISKTIPLRALTGFVGGSTGHATANLISQGDIGSKEDLLKSGITGGVMNLALPAMQDGAGRLIDGVNAKIGRGAPIGRFVDHQGWSDNTSLTDLVKQSPLTRVKVGDQPGSSVDLTKNVVELGRNAGPEKLGHEVHHRITARDPEVKARFDSVADMLNPKSENYNPDQAWVKYRDLRGTQELAARESENAIIAENGAKLPRVQTAVSDIALQEATPGKTYEQVWKDEFQQMKESGGTFRPQKEYSGEDKGAYIDPTTGYITEFSREPRTYKIGDEEVQAIGYERSVDKSFERLTKPDSVDIGGYTWGQVEFHHNGVKTNWGMADRIETFPDQTIKLHIIEGDNGVDTGSTFEVYNNLKETEFGFAKNKEQLASGEIVITKLGDRRTWEYPQPKEMSFGDVSKIDERDDGVTAYYTTKGDVMEQHTVGTADSNYGKLPLILRKANGDVQYSSPEGVSVDVQRVDGQLHVVQRNNGETVSDFKTTEPIREDFPPEEYPQGKVTKFGKVKSIEIQPDKTVYERADGAMVIEFPEPVQTDFGVVKHVVRTENGTEFWREDGSHYEEFHQAILTPYGRVTGKDVAADKTETYTRESGDPVKNGDPVVEDYPDGLGTSLGRVTKIERTGTKVIYTKEGGNVVEVPLVGDPTIMETNQATGTISEVHADKIIEQYPQGRETPYGVANTVIVKMDGTTVFKIANDPKVIDVTEYSNPVPTKIGAVRAVSALRDGNVIVILSDGSRQSMPGANLPGLFQGQG